MIPPLVVTWYNMADQVQKFLTGALPTPRGRLASSPPYRIIGDTPSSWIWIPKNLSMWGNAVDGCCVTTEEAFAKACTGIFISDQVVLKWAKDHGVLNGAYLDQVLDWMLTGGFGQDGNTYNDGNKLAIDYTNVVAMRNAISKGPVKIGVAAGQLQNVVTNHNGWFGTGFGHDGNLDHCISLAGYGTIAWLAQQLGVNVPQGVDGSQPGYAAFTWSTIGILDTPSMLNITGEAWFRNPTTMIVGTNPVTPDPVYTPTPVPPTPTPVPPTPTPVPPTPMPTPPLPPMPAPLFKGRVNRPIPKGGAFMPHAPVAIPVGTYGWVLLSGRDSIPDIEIVD